MTLRKNSRKRQAILEALMATTEHPTAEALYQALKPAYPDLSLGTVYRNLGLFADAGEILRLGAVHGQERFDGRTDPHAHLLCTRCGRLRDVEAPELESRLCEAARRTTGARVEHCALTFTGVCADCLSDSGDTPVSR